MSQTNEMPATYMPRLAKDLGLLPARTICECSVGPIIESVGFHFRGDCERLLLIEPVPSLAEVARKVINAPVLQAAIGMEPGRVTMIENQGSSFIKGTWCPTPETGAEFEVEVVTFDTVDDGQIDILNLDCEGSEWAVLSKMVSRPRLLNVEIWPGNPYTQEINHWLEENFYAMVCYTGPHGETKLYVKS